jgi:hypothetical protein
MATIAQTFTVSSVEVSYRIQEDGCDPSDVSTGGGLGTVGVQKHCNPPHPHIYTKNRLL